MKRAPNPFIKLIRRANALRDREDGAISVEIALLSIVTLAILVGLVEFGLVIRSRMEVSSGVRAGAQYAIADPDDTVAIENAVKTSANLDPEELTVTVTQTCECGDGTPVACADRASCTSQARVFVSVQAAYNHSLILGYPGIPDPIQVSRLTTFRVQ